MIKISLIIPAHNETQLLPRLLDTVDEARGRFIGGADAVEVIVADNASTDGTAKLAATRGCVVVPVAQRLIAAARNGGARAAQGEILCFVDADMRIHPETFNGVSAILTRSNIVAGATGVRLERWSVGIAITYAAMLPLVFLTGMDTGVVFCRRVDFNAVGGYDERREMAEDLAFLWALRRLGKTRGQRLIRLTEIKAITSMRKFDQYGDWHYFTKVMPLGVPALLRPAGRTKLASRYWYGNDR
ncbi:MAG: glycosyltransferase [Desulfobacterales bacterium]|nr:glycosyltransferase [Desulfobacterales bacterium]